LGGIVLLLGKSGADVEWVIHFDRHNTRCEKAHHRSGGPIAAFLLALFEFAETITNMAAATKHIPATPYRTLMTILHLGRANYQKTDAQAACLPAPVPAPSQSCPPAVSPSNQSHDQQQNQSANGGINDCGYSARAKVNADLRQKPTTNESAGNSDNEIADQPESGALYRLTYEPSGNDANNEYDEQTFARHRRLSWIHRGRKTAQSKSLPVVDRGSADAVSRFR
jgi:hypothetical protein